MLSKTILLLASLMLVFQLSSAAFNVTQCYQCEHFDHENADSVSNEKCKENPPPDEFLVNCEEASEEKASTWQCVKVSGRIEVDEENFNYIARKCSPGRTYGLTKDCKDIKVYETKYGYIKRGKHCVCDDDNACNTANGISTGSMATLILGLALAAGLSKFC